MTNIYRRVAFGAVATAVMITMLPVPANAASMAERGVAAGLEVGLLFGQVGAWLVVFWLAQRIAINLTK